MWQLLEEASGEDSDFRCHDDFQGTGSKGAASQGRNYGFGRVCGTSKNNARCACVSNSTENAKGVVYLSQRNQSTDFPVLTCAVANRSGRYVAVIGASPYMAEPVWDEEGILDGLADAKTDGNAALTDNSENNAKIDKFAGYVAEHIRFGSNIRAGAEYREIICRVLTRRAVTQSLDICDDIKHEH